MTDPNREQSPPVPVRDSVVMKVGRSLNVDVLANDFDADGDVLAVTDARLQQVGLAGIDVKVIDRRFVRVQVDQDPGQPLVIEYLVTDGRSPDSSRPVGRERGSGHPAISDRCRLTTRSGFGSTTS